MTNDQLHNAKSEKKSEFWTRYEDIEAEMNAYHEYNPDVFRGKTILCPCDDPAKSEFTRYFIARAKDFGVKRLICTSYAGSYLSQNPLPEERNLPCFDEKKHFTNGRIYDMVCDEKFPANTMGLSWEYLEGDGDFRSEEVTKLRDESDVIITNGPFALFREFLAWIMKANKKFIIIGNQNAITYKEVFPLIKENKVWLGNGFKGNVGFFKSPYEDVASAGEHKEGMIRVSGVMWFTNIDHGKRHEPISLMTMADNLKFNKKLKKKLMKDYGKLEYPHYDNYDAIEVPFTEAIPSDYKPCWYDCEKASECPYAKAEGIGDTAALCEGTCNGNMGVPITYLDKHNPEEFGIIKFRKGDDGKDLCYTKGGANEGLFTDCSSRERERETNNSSTVFPYRYQKEESATESWESPSLSSINSLQNNLKSSGQPKAKEQASPTACGRAEPHSLLSTGTGNTNGFSLSQKCNGIMGVPITYLDKHNPDQFMLLGVFNHGKDGPWDFAVSRVNGVEKYKRLAIRRKPK